MRKTIIGIILILTGLLCYGEEYYRNVIPGVPIAPGKRLGGVYEKTTPKCSHEVSPIDLTKEKMVVESYDKISKGIGIFVIALVISIMFANGITHKLCDIAMGAGGCWALLGFVKLFVATYLFWFCVGAFILIVILLVYRLRGRSILNSAKWLKEKIKHGNSNKS